MDDPLYLTDPPSRGRAEFSVEPVPIQLFGPPSSERGSAERLSPIETMFLSFLNSDSPTEAYELVSPFPNSAEGLSGLPAKLRAIARDLESALRIDPATTQELLDERREKHRAARQAAREQECEEP